LYLLEQIDVNQNLITKIDESAFADLTNLAKVELQANTCINKNFSTDLSNMDTLSTEVKTDCGNNDELDKTFIIKSLNETCEAKINNLTENLNISLGEIENLSSQVQICEAEKSSAPEELTSSFRTYIDEPKMTNETSVNPLISNCTETSHISHILLTILIVSAIWLAAIYFWRFFVSKRGRRQNYYPNEPISYEDIKIHHDEKI